MSAPAYLIVEMNISDPERYKQYMAQAPACVKAFGGEYIVRGGRKRDARGRLAAPSRGLAEIPELRAGKAFYDDGPYREVRKLRLGATEYFNMVLVEGVAAPV